MDIQALERRIQALEEWKTERERQQITFPLDEKSITILNKYFLRKLQNLDFTNASGDVIRNIMLMQDGKVDVVTGYTYLYRYRVDTSSNTLYIGQDVVNLAQGSFIDDQQVWTLSTNTAPSPLSDALPYYVINASNGGTQIQLSTTLGGSAIDITTIGTGEHFIYPF